MSAFDQYAETIRGVPPLAADAALALGILSFGTIELALSRPEDEPPPYHLNHWSIVLFAMMSLPLVLGAGT